MNGMKLIITRHGETVENTKRIIQSHLPGHLSELGKEQAKKLAKRLREEKIDCIYSSDLSRAADTAREIAKFHPEAPLVLTKDLRERNLGKFQGLCANGVDWKKERRNWLMPKGGESNKDMYVRAKKFIFKIIKKHKRGTILLVGHNGIDKALIAVITGKNADEISTIESLGNTSVNIFEIDDDGYEMLLINDTTHLD